MGYIQCDLDTHKESQTDGWTNFIVWLDSRGYSSPKGWALSIIEEVGDGVPAFDRFKELLFEFIETECPDWFIQYNLSKQPSVGLRGVFTDGTYENMIFVPSKDDIRIPKHILLAAQHV